MNGNLVVVDSSVFASALLEEGSEYADALMKSRDPLVFLVPALWQAEIANVLLVAVKRRRIDRSQVDLLIAELLHMALRVSPLGYPEGLWAIVELAERHGLTAYDATYLEAAIRNDCCLATLDKQLAAAAKAEGRFWTGSPEAPTHPTGSGSGSSS